MFRCAPAVCLWLALILLPSLQAKVNAPAQLQAMLGYPFILGCNVTIDAKEVLKQVRWLNVQNKTILHYQPQKPGSLTRHDGVELITQKAHTSAIAIKKAKPGDEGCYTCVFDVYPTGQQEGKTCLFIVAKVESVGNKTAVGGKTTTLSCTYALPERVQQVLWRKTAEQGDTATVASYTKQGRVTVEVPFQDRMKLSQSLGHSLLTINSVHTEDEGCYTCDFHTYPLGSRSMTACLAVYVLPKPEVSSATIEPGVVQANCTAVSRPPAELMWNHHPATGWTTGRKASDVYSHAPRPGNKHFCSFEQDWQYPHHPPLCGLRSACTAHMLMCLSEEVLATRTETID
ncbi:hypothetical protein MHYP_G00097780 [Metynnis hypsauchen]